MRIWLVLVIALQITGIISLHLLCRTSDQLPEVEPSIIEAPPVKHSPWTSNPWDPPLQMQWYSDAEKNYYIFNPTIIALPSSSPYPYLGAARLPTVRKQVAGFDDPIYLSNMILCYMRLINTPRKSLNCVHEPIQPHIEVPYDLLKEKLKGDSDQYSWNRFVGAEDPRFVWDEHGMPMMLYGMNSLTKTRKRTVWINDVRNVLPAIGNMWGDKCGIKPSPIFNNTELGSNVSDSLDLIHELEKNWAPMISPQLGLLFHSNIAPRIIFKPHATTDGSGDVNLELLREVDNSAFISCFSKIYNSPQNQEGNYLHQATNMLRITNCFYHECVSDNSNTFYFQIFHIKSQIQQTTHYERYLVLWNTTAPKYKFESLIGPLALPGLADAKMQFVVSMNFLPEAFHEAKCGADMDLGFLDTHLMLSIGDQDYGTKSLIVTAQSLLSGQKRCS